MKYDGPLCVAVGHSARSLRWKNHAKYMWSDLVERLQTEHKTTETLKEYRSASRDERSKIKDVGGYVAGYLRGGRRKPENVASRSAITLDLDFSDPDLWEDLTMVYNNAAILHTTHSHTPENPKFRLIMPLSRECTPDEYTAVARRIAGTLGIDQFDTTSFQPYRLMFWPSNPKDVPYVCNFQDGPWVDVEATLATYKDWRDTSLWPTAGAQIEAINKLANKQADPRTKRGIVGAFCRTYDIIDAIDTFLPNEYEASPVVENRYTYKLGSAANGVTIHGLDGADLWAYSYHGTDPAGGSLCNSFDLVRIHRFGHLDTDSTTNGSKTPSYKAMEGLAKGDAGVKRTIAADNIDAGRYDFAEGYEEPVVPTRPSAVDDFGEDVEEVDAVDPLAWAEDLEVDARSKYLSSAPNLNLILGNDPRLAGAFAYNQFDTKHYLMKSVPWRVIDAPEPVKNVDGPGLRNYIETTYGIVSAGKIKDRLLLEFERHAFHPIKDYLDGLVWDGESRVDSLLVDYFGAPNNAYSREAIRKMLAGAVARIYRPGTKFDLVLVLVSSEGQFKSTFIKKLGVGWASDSFMTVHGKEAFEQLQGAWLIEMAELSGMRKADVEAVKHYITKEEDTFRPAYGEVVETFKRQCVFFATTNKSDFLHSGNGNRRFMPIEVMPHRVTRKVTEMERPEVDQIWAEAVTLYHAGEKLFLGQEAEQLARVARREHSELDERQGLVLRYLDTALPTNWATLDVFERRRFLQDPESKGTIQRDAVCIAEIWAELFENEPGKIDPYKTRELNTLLRSLEGWSYAKNGKRFGFYGSQRYYSRDL